MTNCKYFIWLQTALGIGANLSKSAEVFSSPEEIYHAGERELLLSGVFTEKQIDRLLSVPVEASYKILEACEDLGVEVVTAGDASYPQGLLMLENYPAVLYVKGDFSCLARKIPIAVVGARDCSAKSRASAQALAGTLSKSGFTIVSGGAIGIDAAAHTGAILAGGETVAVLGSGIGARYLRENEPLRRAVEKHGALVSELPPLTEPYKGTFPIRNRIIAALTVGTIVVEAGIKSGSLITAKNAGELGRDVFAVPPEAIGSSSNGARELIEDGATTVLCGMDIVGEYILRYPEKIVVDTSIDLMQSIAGFGLEAFENLPRSFMGDSQRNAEQQVQKSEQETRAEQKAKPQQETRAKQTAKPKQEARAERKAKPKQEARAEQVQGPKKRKSAEGVSDAARRVYEMFGATPIGIDDIAGKQVMPMNSILGAITELELLGYIELLPDTKYILKREG